MIHEYISILVIGLRGGFSHCLGMCGGFVMTFSINLRGSNFTLPADKWFNWRAHLLYNGG